MKEVLTISGKGGTGKTSLTGCFAQLASGHVVADCDVDAANLYLLLNPESTQSKDFYCGYISRLDREKCVGCGKCKELCRFGAIDDAIDLRGDTISLNLTACEGCGVCADHCPTGALSLVDRLTGDICVSQTRYAPFVHGKLGAGGENSGKLVSEVRKLARETAEKEKRELIIIDGPPGIGCPVIASVGGVDYAVLVTEPTLAGMHDLRRIARLVQHFNIRAGVVINKSDLNEKNAWAIEDFAKAEQIDLLGSLPYSPVFNQAQRTGKTVIEYGGDNGIIDTVAKIWKKVASNLS